MIPAVVPRFVSSPWMELTTIVLRTGETRAEERCRNNNGVSIALVALPWVLARAVSRCTLGASRKTNVYSALVDLERKHAQGAQKVERRWLVSTEKIARSLLKRGKGALCAQVATHVGSRHAWKAAQARLERQIGVRATVSYRLVRVRT